VRTAPRRRRRLVRERCGVRGARSAGERSTDACAGRSPTGRTAGAGRSAEMRWRQSGATKWVSMRVRALVQRSRLSTERPHRSSRLRGPPLRLISRVIVEGARPSLVAIARHDSPAANRLQPAVWDPGGAPKTRSLTPAAQLAADRASYVTTRQGGGRAVARCGFAQRSRRVLSHRWQPSATSVPIAVRLRGVLDVH
jgi:hypothetical protein